MHVLVARRGGEFRYGAFVREHATGDWSMFASGNRLQAVVEEALALTFKPNIAADLTFSTRSSEVVMADLIETPEQLATGARGCRVEVLCREGRFDTPDDRWASVYRGPAGREIYCFGLDSVFRPQTLKAQIEGWFESAGWASFGPPRPNRGDPTPPPWPRELLVRRGDEWSARRICPDSFPQLREGPVVSAEQQARRLAKLPQSKAAARRLKHQENDARFKTEAAERARQREEGAAGA